MSRGHDVRDVRGLSSSRVWDYENGFYWHSDVSRIGKLLAHRDLYASVASLPGSVVELGVYKAASLIRWATFRRLFENDGSRQIVGFDAFGKFPTQGVTAAVDRQFIERFEAAGEDGLSVDETSAILAAKGFDNIALLPGDVLDTVPDYLAENPEVRVALLHLDMDVYEPTAFALDQFAARVVGGGVIVVDDYGAVAGATQALDEFVGRTGLRLEKLAYYSVPTFIRMPHGGRDGTTPESHRVALPGSSA
jgi:hypothetical protein